MLENFWLNFYLDKTCTCAFFVSSNLDLSWGKSFNLGGIALIWCDFLVTLTPPSDRWEKIDEEKIPRNNRLSTWIYKKIKIEIENESFGRSACDIRRRLVKMTELEMTE